jgi:predicted PurR-regulated permease PerM
MTEPADEPEVLPEPQAAPAVVESAAVTTVPTELAPGAAVAAARFKPMPAPSAPFVLALIAVVIFTAIIVASWSVVFMFGIGLVLFAILLPVVNWLERRGLRRGIASLIMVLLLVLVAIGAALFFVNVWFNQIVPFFVAIPDVLANIADKSPPWLAAAINDILDAINSATSGIDVGQVVLGFLKGIFGLLGTALSLTLLPFFIFYLLTDQPRMARSMKEDIPSPWRPYIDTSIRIFVRDFGQYFKAELIVGLIQGTMVAVGVWLIGLVVGPPLSEFWLLLGVIAGIMELLPQIGPIISLIPALFLALATSPLALVLTTIFYLVVFVIEANVLVPKIEGGVIEFSPAAVLFIVAVGLAIGGIIGGIIALPVAAIIRDLFGFIFREAQRDSLVDASRAPPEARPT